MRYRTWYAVALRRGYAAVPDFGTARHSTARHGTAWRGAARLGSARRGAVCHAVVLPADIFIGDRATCNRLRGIRTERCFAHLYPRFAARPIQRQPSLSVLALSQILFASFVLVALAPFFHLVPPPPLLPRFLSPRPLSLSAQNAAKATEGWSSRRRAAETN